MIDYVMPITKENLEVLHNMGFILSRGCKDFINTGDEAFQIVFLGGDSTPKYIFNMDSDQGKPTKTITLQNAQEIMLLINLGLNTESIRESIKET